MAGLYSNSTIVNYLSGLRAWHIIHGLEWALNENETNALLKASKSLSPPSAKHPPCKPYTVDIIVKIRAHLDTTHPLEATVFACLTTTFFTTARTGEFTVPNLNAFNPTLHISCQLMSIQHDRQGLEITNFHLPCMKTAPQGEDINWAKQDGPADPQAALLNHFKINEPPQNHHLFAYRVQNGHRPLTRQKFLKTLKMALKKANLPILKGHGIHIRSTLEYLLCNIPFDIVKVKGRWASNSFLVYLRRHMQILAPFMQAKPSLHHSFLHFTLPPTHN